MIELKHINKIYNGFNALNDISLTIKDGEICGIIGQSGAGKSTLVRCINHAGTANFRRCYRERKKYGHPFKKRTP